jgi:hypothetical protein
MRPKRSLWNPNLPARIFVPVSGFPPNSGRFAGVDCKSHARWKPNPSSETIGIKWVNQKGMRNPERFTRQGWRSDFASDQVLIGIHPSILLSVFRFNGVILFREA